MQKSFKPNAETPKFRRGRTIALLSSGAAIGGLLVERLQRADRRLVALTDR